jgi:protein phosphatase PTC7
LPFSKKKQDANENLNDQKMRIIGNGMVHSPDGAALYAGEVRRPPPLRTGVGYASRQTPGMTTLERPYQAKQTVLPTDMSRLVLRSSAVVIPHPDKAGSTYDMPPFCGGEDAYFINEDAGVLGVADGVGGWITKGIDAGIYSRQLMNNALEEVQSGIGDPALVLERAHVRTTAAGSSTALVLKFEGGDGEKQGIVTAANLGDSGFLHLRGKQVLYQSVPQQHYFNFPFQLSAPGGMHNASSHPDQADYVVLHGIKKGDVLVLGTDGLFDNAFAEEIASIVSSASGMSGVKDRAFAQRAANDIARWTQTWAADDYRMSPFAVEAFQMEGHRFRGGKQDDITVIVAVVAGETESAETDSRDMQ